MTIRIPRRRCGGRSGCLAALTARAGVHTPVSACASGAEAIALALDLLRAGRADVVVAGGTEAAIASLPIAGFAAMRALSTREDEPETASRPYDKARDGFVLGEGAAVLVLETREHAHRRGARIYAELAGAGISADAHHVAAPEPTGAGAARALTLAMRDAGLQPIDVVHVNAHATSTPLGDASETRVIKRALGEENARRVAVSGTKGATGHMLGGAGAAEAIFTMLAMHEQKLPPTINYEEPDPECDLDYVPNDARDAPGAAVGVSNSFGFGGHNASIVVRRWAE